VVSRPGKARLHLFLKTERIIHPQPKAYSRKNWASFWPETVLVRPKKRRFKLVALGGTFDFLHKGHRQLLSKAFSNSDKVIIGVTSDKLVRKMRKSHPVQPYKTRVRELEKFLQAKGRDRRARITRLQEPFGPPKTDPKVEALIVTSNTIESGKQLNKLRKRKNLPELVLVQTRFTRAQDNKIVSSTRIRNGEIDREGRLMQKP